MFKRIYRARFTCSKYVTNLFIILFIVRGVASVIESDVYGRIGNTTASLRFTRQKVLIQAVESPKKFGDKRHTREKHEIQNQNPLPDIVVEEFRIRAKINFQTRPWTKCKDFIRDCPNHTKSSIGLSNSRDQRILYGRAESLMKNNKRRFEDKFSTRRLNDKSIVNSKNIELQKQNNLSETTNEFSNIKINYNDTDKNDLRPVDYNEKLYENFNNFLSSSKKDKNQKSDWKKEYLQHLLHRRYKIPTSIDGRSSLSYNSSDESRSHLSKNKITSSRQFYKTLLPHRTTDSINNMNSGYSETKKHDAERQSKAHFFKKSKELVPYNIFDDKLNEKSHWQKQSEFRDYASTVNQIEMGNTKSLNILDDEKITERQNNELDKPRLLTFSSDYRRKLSKRSIKNVEIAHPCHKKIRTNTTNNSTALRLKRKDANIPMITRHFDDHETFYTENRKHFISNKSSEKLDKNSNEDVQFERHRRYGRSLKSLNNSTTTVKHNEQKKNSKKSSNLNNKKINKLDNSGNKSKFQIPKNLTSKTNNSRKTKIKLIKRWNDTIWNDFGTYPVVTNFVMNFLNLISKPFTEYFIKKNKNESTLVREIINTNNLSSLINLANLTKHNRTIGTEFSSPSSIEDSISTSIVNTLTILSKTSRDATNDANFRFSMETTFTTEQITTTKVKNSNITKDSFISTTELISKDFNNNSIDSNHQTTESPIRIEKNLNGTLNSHLLNNKEKSEIEMKVKTIGNVNENLTNTLSETTSEKSQDCHGKSTFNFTVIDTNCREQALLNSLSNNSVNQASNIAEVISQMPKQPTSKRYSRNDTVDEIASSNNKFLNVRSNDAKNRETEKSFNDFINPSNVLRKVHGGLGNRGRKRSRYKGKMQQPFVASSLPRIGKQSWRRNNASVISISSISPTVINDSLNTRENERSTASPISGNLPESKSSTITPTTDWRQIQISRNASILDSTNHEYLTQTAKTFSRNDESSVSSSASILMNEIFRIGTTTISYDFSEKKELKVPTFSSETSKGSNFVNFSSSNEISTKSTFPTRDSKSNEAVGNNEISTMKLIELSTVSYDKSISVDPLIIQKTDNSILSKDSVGHNFGRKEEIKSEIINVENSKMEETKKDEVTEPSTISKISVVTTRTTISIESKQENERTIVNNTAEPLTFSYNESSVTDTSIINGIKFPTRKNTTINDSSTTEVNEIPYERINALSNLNETIQQDLKQVFILNSTKNETLEAVRPKIQRKESFGVKSLIELNYSTNSPDKNIEKVDPTYPENTTEFYFRLRTNEDEKMNENFTDKSVSSSSSEIIDSFNDSLTSIGSKVSSSNWKNTTNVDVTSITINPDIKRKTIPSEAESVIDSPTIFQSSIKNKIIEKKILPSAFLPRTARRTRDTRTLSEYEEPQESELDYDVDNLGAIEEVTEAIINIGEDTAEGSRGYLIPKNSYFINRLPHSAVHGVYLEDNKANDDPESTIIPGINLIRDDQSLHVSTARSSNGFQISNEYSNNLTNLLDEPDILAFVKSLEEFLFDDSATGTFDRKQLLLRDEDLDAESSNLNTESRSAIFRIKKFTNVDKKIVKNVKNTHGMNNGAKTKSSQSVKSTSKKLSDVSSSGKQIRPKNVNEKMRRIKIDREHKKTIKDNINVSIKDRKANISRTQSTFNNKRAADKRRNSTKVTSANKWRSNVNKK